MLIVGAGLSGIGAAAHLQRRCPTRRFALLEARPAIGGTWDLFRYPGIRSDSDMYTLGYAFKPWTRRRRRSPTARRSATTSPRPPPSTASTAHIRFGHRVVRADWSAAEARWTVEVDAATTARAVDAARRASSTSAAATTATTQGHRPRFPGEADFRGTLVHPQYWPRGLDYAGKRVVVIGSGATAVTLVPELAETAAHVTMLQRSPTYMSSPAAGDAIAEWLQRWLPATLAYRLVRAEERAAAACASTAWRASSPRRPRRG